MPTAAQKPKVQSYAIIEELKTNNATFTLVSKVYYIPHYGYSLAVYLHNTSVGEGSQPENDHGARRRFIRHSNRPTPHGLSEAVKKARFGEHYIELIQEVLRDNNLALI